MSSVSFVVAQFIPGTPTGHPVHWVSLSSFGGGGGGPRTGSWVPSGSLVSFEGHLGVVGLIWGRSVHSGGA